MLTWKLVTPFMAVVLVALLGVTLPLQPIVVTDTRIVQFRFEELNPSDCLQSAEAQALRAMSDSQRVRHLHHALTQLHDTSEDPLWQPLLEVLAPKTIYLDARTFAQTNESPSAIALTRYTRRLDLTWASAEFSPRLTYRINLKSNTGSLPSIEIQSPEHQQGPVAVLKPERVSNDVHLDHLHISSCAADALQRYYVATPWLLAPTSEQGYCRLHNEQVTAMRFYFACTGIGIASQVAH